MISAVFVQLSLDESHDEPLKWKEFHQNGGSIAMYQLFYRGDLD